MTALEFSGPGLTAEQWAHIKALATSLSPQQLLWVSGYLAGVDGARRHDFSEFTVGQADAPRASAEDVRSITILFGSETGNSAALAAQLKIAFEAAGLAPRIIDMADYKVRQLKEEQDLLIITSTHGEGDPPQAAADFFEFVEGRKAPKLDHLRYGVLALGDSTYEFYCEAGRRLDERLAALGAKRFSPRVDCDIDYDDAAAAWIASVCAELASARPARRVGPVEEARRLPPAASPAFDRRNPFLAPVVDNMVLTGRGSSKETRHVEVALSGSGLTFQPGDALGVTPRNDPRLVERLIECFGLCDAEVLLNKPGRPHADERVGRETTLSEAFERDLEITAATPRFLQHWADLCGAHALKTLLAPDRADERHAFLSTHQVIDIVRAFPAPGVEAAAVVAGLRPLQPRLYSIASSPNVFEDEAHLTVATVRFDLHGEARSGVASGQLADRIAPDDLLPVYVQANPHFRLPRPDAPIVMIGAGTGVAPFRAFLQERQAQEALGRSWLFFGERNFRTDFLYQTEWQRFLKDGALSRMDVAFSRDNVQKDYVQHRLLERAADLYAWLEDGAHLYVCGDASRLAPDVDEALTLVLMQEGQSSREAAAERLRELAREHRYQRDVY